MDKDLFHILILPAFALLTAFLLCNFHMAKKGKGLNAKEKKDMFIFFLIMVGVMGWFFFFHDEDVVFDCRKETSTCVYYHSTLANKQLREAKRYDISDARTVRIDERRHRSRHGYYGRKYYKVVITANHGDIAIPFEFDFREDAEKQAAKFSKFLNSEKPRCVFKDLHAKNYAGLFFIIMGSVFTCMFSIIGLSILFSKRFST